MRKGGREVYVFADAVHSGNHLYKLSNEEIEIRMLRNKLGGSTILCGADKLAEGWDNPLVEVLFMTRPLRKSNTKLWQQAGRPGRLLAGKEYAIIFEFIYDKGNQLLLSSTDMLNAMSYGLPEPLVISIDNKDHYKIKTDFNYQGTQNRPSQD